MAARCQGAARCQWAARRRGSIRCCWAARCRGAARPLPRCRRIILLMNPCFERI